MSRSNLLFVVATTPMLLAAAVHAEPTAKPFAKVALEELCTDRPTKSNFACTVDEGHFQYEADGINFSHLDVGGTTTDVVLYTNPTLKYGLTKTVDLEANIAPWVTVRTRDAGGATTTLRGVGDLYLRVKWNFLGDPDGKLSMTVLPYVKAPTARRGIGNRAVEEGFLLPTNYQLTPVLVLTTVPEFDVLKNADGAGHHFATSQLVNAGYTFANGVTLYGELWASINADPAGTVHQYSADIAAAWGVTKTLQFDVGVNAGLNRATPSVQAYVGASQKF
jgi:hypothetical protein